MGLAQGYLASCARVLFATGMLLVAVELYSSVVASVVRCGHLVEPPRGLLSWAWDLNSQGFLIYLVHFLLLDLLLPYFASFGHMCP